MGTYEELNSIRLPYLAARAEAADALIESAVLTPVSSVVTIYARALSVSSPSFTNRLVKLLAERGFRQLVVRGSNGRFRRELNAALESNPTVVLRKVGEAAW